MEEQKDKQKLSDIFFGKADKVFANIRLFLRSKKITKIISAEKEAIADVKAKLAELYEGEIGEIREEKKEKIADASESSTLEIPKVELSESEMTFVPLSEIWQKSPYSKNYVNYSARQGKLRAKKIGGVWHTTEEWLAEFTEKSQAKKNKFKERLSRDHGGHKKFVEEKSPSSSPFTKGGESSSLPLAKGESERDFGTNKIFGEIREIKRGIKKFLRKIFADTKKWFSELREMGGARKKVSLKEFSRRELRPALAMIALVALIAFANITQADLGNWGDWGKKQMYFAFNAGVDGIAKTALVVNDGAGKSIAKLKVGTDKFAGIAANVLRREKIAEFEKTSGLKLTGSEEGKGEVAGVESNPGNLGDLGGRVLAAATTSGAAKANPGDLEVSVYLMDQNNKEVPNGEYDVRFGIYTTDRTESDPYPSDTDKGTRVWEETQKVQVENGLLHAYLGDTTPIPASLNFATSNYYIGVRVGQDAEMAPRKRIGAVPLSRTAMNIAGQTIGNASGNIPVSNGTLNTNLNADMLDGLHSTAFQPAGTYLTSAPAEYLPWKLQSSSSDSGQKINSGKGAIFTGTNGIATSRTLNTLIISLDATSSPTLTGLTLSGLLPYGVIYSDAASALRTVASGAEGQVLTYHVGSAPTWDATPPAAGQYVVMSADASLPNERVLTGTANQIIVTDGGAGGAVTLSTPQDINITSSPTFATLNTGQGANELYAMDQNVRTTDAVIFSTLNTGQGANELYAMNQNVRTTDSPSFTGLTVSGLTPNYPVITGIGGVLATEQYLNVTRGGTGAGTFTQYGVIYGDTTNALKVTGAGTEGQILTSHLGSAPTWESTAPAAAHAVLSVQHSDVTPAAVQRGDLITGQGVAPTWSRLAKGGVNTFLRSDGTDLAWSTITLGTNTTGNYVSTITGTADQVITTGATGDITLSLPQSINTTSAPTFVTLNTGQGANELYAMDQNVRTSDSPTFATLYLTTLDLGTNTITDGNFNGGAWSFNSNALTGVSSIDTVNISSTALTFTSTAPTISVSTAATAINLDAGTTGDVNIAGISTGSINFGGGSAGGSGCTIDNTTGNLTCSGDIGGGGTGSVGYWTRTGTTLTPKNAGDVVNVVANGSNTSGTLFRIYYSAAATLNGALVGADVDLNDGHVSPINQNVTGLRVVLPTTTNTNGVGTTITYNGMSLGYGVGTGINQNGAGATVYNGANLLMPALSQTQGSLTANGALITTSSSITTGGTANGVNIAATGVNAGSLNGLYISAITGSGGTERAIAVGSGWDSVLTVNGTAVINGSGVVPATAGGTGLTSYAAGDLIYADTASSFTNLAAGAGNNGKILVVSGGVPTWGVMAGSSCTDCVLNDPTSVTTQTIVPNNQNISSLIVRQTTYVGGGGPTHNIFEVTNFDGSAVYFYVDKDGNVSTGGVASQTLTLTPASNTTALTLVGTNVTTAALQYINAKNTQGTISNLAYGAVQTITGALTGESINLATNVTATDQSVTGISVTLPTPTNTTSTSNYKGIAITGSGGGGLNQSGAGTTVFSGVDVTIPALTQTAGSLTANGVNVATPATITTGGTANGVNIAATGVGAGTLRGLNISDLATGAGAGSETAIHTGTGWDYAAIFEAGNVGIGTTSPGSKLDISGSARIYDQTAVTGVSTLTVRAGAGQATSPLAIWQNNAGTGLGAIDGGGNIGIGTTTPGQKIDVIGGSVRTDNQFISTLAIGTAPLVVTSTTLNTNLNADLLDGLHKTSLGASLDTNGNNIRLLNSDATILSTITAPFATNASQSAITDDTTTNSAMYPTWVTANTGNLPLKVTSSKLTFNPSTGTLASTIFSGSGSGLTGITNTNLSGSAGITNANLANSSMTIAGTSVSLGGSITQDTITGLASTGLVKRTGANTLSIASSGTDYIAGGTGANHQIAYFTASGTLAGSDTMWFDGANVGIGTTTPGAKLQVDQSGAVTTASYGLAVYNTATTATDAPNKYGLYVSSTGNWLGIGATNYGLYVAAPTGATNGTNTTALFAGSLGNVSVDGNGAILGFSRNGANYIKASDVSGSLAFQTGGANTRLNIDSSGNVAVNTNQLYINQANGNVGIGTTTPAYKLEVIGSINIPTGSTYKVNGVDVIGLWGTYGSDIANLNVGNVGIGTTTPGYNLDVRAATATFGITSTTGTNAVYAQMINTSGLLTIGVENSVGGALATGSAAYAAVLVNSQARSLHLGTSGAARMTIDSGGNVGIGTTAPSYRLDILQSDNYGIRVWDGTNLGGSIGFQATVNGANNGYLIHNQRYNGSGWVADDATKGSNVVTFDSGGNTTFYGQASGNGLVATPQMVIQQSGNVGIGTTNPSEILHVNGGNLSAIRNELSIWMAGNSVGSETNWTMNAYYSSGWKYRLADEASRIQMINGITTFSSAAVGVADGALSWTDNITILQNGNVGIGTTSPGAKLHVSVDSGNVNGFISTGDNATPALWLANNYPTSPNYGGMGLSSDNSLRFTTTGSFNTASLTISPSGNVGIGTTNPGNLLHVYANEGTATPLARLQQVNTGGYATLQIDRASNARVVATSYSTGGTDEWYTGELYNGGSANTKFSIATGNALSDSKMVIQNDGNVGIGTTTPDVPLYVNRDLGTSYQRIASFVNPNAGDSTTYITIGKGTTTASTSGVFGYDTASTVTWIGVAGDGLGTGLHVKKGGNVGIGTTSPNQKLEVNGRIRMATWTADGNTAVYYNSATGDIGVNSSDVRLKTNIQTIPDALAIIEGINGVTYNLKTDPTGTQKTVGVIAQDVAAAMPELTFPITGPDGKEYLSVHYDKLAPVLINAVKEQQTQIFGINSQVGDLNLKTSQNVETVQQLQKSVDQNLVVISNNLSALSAGEAELNSAVQKNTSDISALGARISSVEQNTADISRNLSELTATVNAMGETESMIVSRLTDHETRLTALEAKMLAGSGGTSASSTPSGTFELSPGLKKFDTALAASSDVSGNPVFALAGTFKAQVLGAESLHLGKQVSGSGTLKSGDTEVVIPSSEVKSDSKIYITPTGKLSGESLYVDMKKVKDGESFTVELDGAALTSDADFNWLVVN